MSFALGDFVRQCLELSPEVIITSSKRLSGITKQKPYRFALAEIGSQGIERVRQ
jgi:hypothetical protein